MEIIFLIVGLLLAYAQFLVLFIAYWIVTHLGERQAREFGLRTDRLGDLSFWLGIGALLGARLPFVLPYLEAHLANPLDIIRINMGLDLYGGLAGALATLLWFSSRQAVSFWRLGDSYGLHLPLGIALSRFGCLLTGDCYGRVAPAPFGIVFPDLTQPRYPAELYEAGLALAMFLLLWRVRGRLQPEGTVLLTVLAGYPLVRALVDFVRIDVTGAPVAPDQAISLAISVVAVIFLICRRRRFETTGPIGPSQAVTFAAKEKGAR